MIIITEEIWRPVAGYEGRYEISNKGRFKSFAQNSDGKIKTGIKEFKGYMVVRLYDGLGNSEDVKIHRLVANAFIPNPDNLPQVNHRDEDKANNCVENLEWCDNAYNHNYGTRNIRAGAKNRCNPATSKRVYSVSADGTVEEFASVGEASRTTGISHSNIFAALKNQTRRSAGGRKWHYA